jgi:hypothetical protein
MGVAAIEAVFQELPGRANTGLTPVADPDFSGPGHFSLGRTALHQS